MENGVKSKPDYTVRAVLAALLLLPLTVSAHLIAITATTPFPATVPASSTTTALFTVTNITSQATVTVVDQSHFPAGSGLSLAASTCGSPIGPGQSCTIQLNLQPQTAGGITTALKLWAKPSADGVELPIDIKVTRGLPVITLVPVSNNGLPAVRDPVVAKLGDKWLIVSGSLGTFHEFQDTFISDIYVYDPASQQIFSVPVSATDLPDTVVKQLTSSSIQSLQDGDTLYLIGGFYNTPNTNHYDTLNTITSMNVPGMMDAVIKGHTDLAQFVHFNTNVPEFRVTGGQLGKIGNDFYLAYGQYCLGNYCDTLQVYTNSIYRFTTDPALTSIQIIQTATHDGHDGSGWRRRDYTLAPFKSGNTDTLFALAGPFTPGQDAFVWTNGIVFDANLQNNSNFLNQQANQYSSPSLSMYDATSGISYVATFSGLSNLYWSTTGLIYDNTTPYGNILDLISNDPNTGAVQEFANLTPICAGQPVSSCLYTGLLAKFIPISRYYDSRYILQLNQLPKNTPTLIGHVYAGLMSTEPDIFGTNASYVTNQVYEVYVTPEGTGSVNWQNVTNMFPGVS